MHWHALPQLPPALPVVPLLALCVSETNCRLPTVTFLPAVLESLNLMTCHKLRPDALDCVLLPRPGAVATLPSLTDLDISYCQLPPDTITALLQKVRACALALFRQIMLSASERNAVRR
jgi:hypothetical protein